MIKRYVPIKSISLDEIVVPTISPALPLTGHQLKRAAEIRKELKALNKELYQLLRVAVLK